MGERRRVAPLESLAPLLGVAVSVEHLTHDAPEDAWTEPPPDDTERRPPHNLDAEQSLIGAMLLSRDAIATASELVTAEDLYSPRHAHIFDTVLGLWVTGQPVDATTVAADLDARGLTEASGGKQGLLEIQSQTSSSANAEHYARIVAATSTLRRLAATGTEIADLAYRAGDQADDAVETAESLIYRLSAARDTRSTMLDANAALQGYLDELESRTQAGRAGITTGHHVLDRIMLGMRPGQMIVLAGRPSMGKSAAALGIAHHVAVDLRRPVVFYSLEMGHTDICERWVAREASVDARRLSEGKLDDAEWTRIVHAMERLGHVPLYVDNDPRLTPMAMLSRARRIRHRTGDLGLVVVDYLQLMETRRRHDNRQVEVADISRAVKTMAADLGCPVLALCQLNRLVETRHDKTPRLSDLRESGAIEQDADIVLMLHRPEVYEPTPELHGIAEMIVAKHRSGPTGAARLRFRPAFSLFLDDPAWG